MYSSALRSLASCGTFVWLYTECGLVTALNPAVYHCGWNAPHLPVIVTLYFCSRVVSWPRPRCYCSMFHDVWYIHQYVTGRVGLGDPPVRSPVVDEVKKGWSQASGWTEWFLFTSVIQHCWLGDTDRKRIRLVENLIHRISFLEQAEEENGLTEVRLVVVDARPTGYVSELTVIGLTTCGEIESRHSSL